MTKEDFNQVSSSFEAVYFIFDIVSFDISSNMLPLQWLASSLPDKWHLFVFICI
jgi:hypothetical protein